MMIFVNVLHEPIDVKKMMGGIKPEIKHKHVNKNLFNHLEKGELVLFACPIAIKGSVWFNLPNPQCGVDDHKEQGAETK